MTVQFEILTGMLASDMNINPFKGATKKFVKDNFEKAKVYYAGCWRNFLSTWCIERARKQGIIIRFPPTEEENKKIVIAIKEGKIELPPKEWEELKV